MNALGLGYRSMVSVPGVHRFMAIEMTKEKCTSSGATKSM